MCRRRHSAGENASCSIRGMEALGGGTGIRKSAVRLRSAEARIHRGTNQSGMRDYNERLVLSLVRQHGSLAKTEIARLTKLSAQTVSVIMRELEEEGLLLRNEPVRGKIGQPSIPMSLNPEGAFFLGLKIGRRSAELVLIDFLGTVRAMLQLSYRYPAPRETVEFVSQGIKRDPRRADARAGRAHRRPRHRHAVRAVELGRRGRRAARGDGPLAQPRHPRRHPGAVQFSGLPAERRDLGLRRRTGVRPGRHAARLHLFLHRRLRRRRHRSQRRPLWRPDRQCRRARLDAGARAGRHAAPADRHRLDRHAGKGAERATAATPRICGPRRRTGAISARSSTTGSPRPPTASPMRSSRPPR